LHVTPEQIVIRQIEAFNRKDLDGFLACYAPEAVLLADGVVIASGVDALRGIYGSQFTAVPMRVTVLSRQCHGCWVIDHERTTADSGTPTVTALAVYRVAEGLIDQLNILGGEITHSRSR
jgi:hypothetical protein